MQKKCVLLYSGGLDSTLAVFLLKEQNLTIYPLKIITPFFSLKKSYNTENDKLIQEVLSVKIYYYKVDQDYIDIILNHKYPYGSGMNPCIDCKIYMFQKAKEYLKKLNADFIATGEVLGQRPMSQKNFSQIKLIEKEAGVENLVVRPLSAKLLPLSIPEQQGWVNREKFLSISGRERKKQLELAKKYNVRNVSVSGGCLLTDKNFVQRFKDLLNFTSKPTILDIELLHYGRHFYFEDTKIILGRNKKENEILSNYKDDKKFLIITPNHPGPTALCYINHNTDIQKVYSYACNLTKQYSKKSS